MRNDFGDSGAASMRTKALAALAALLLVSFLLPWTAWQRGESEPETYSGLGVLALGFSAAGESREAAIASVEAELAQRRQAVADAEERAEKARTEAAEARAALEADPENARAKRDADRRTRSADMATRAIDDRRAELERAESSGRSYWTHYLFYGYPLLVLLVPLGALATLSFALLGRPNRTRGAATTTGLLVLLAFLAPHLWFGLPLFGLLQAGAWLALAAGLVLIPAALGLEGTAKAIDWINTRIGLGVAWLALFMVLVQFALVLMRYVFGVGSIMTQESLIYAHGILFMVVAGFTLMQGGHVRVDIFYREASPRRKAMVDLFGVVAMLIPVCLLIWAYSLPYVISSWQVLEGSRETSGIPGVFLLKTAMLVFVAVVLLQGVALAFRSVLVLAGRRADAGPAAGGVH